MADVFPMYCTKNGKVKYMRYDIKYVFRPRGLDDGRNIYYTYMKMSRNESSYVFHTSMKPDKDKISFFRNVKTEIKKLYAQ